MSYAFFGVQLVLRSSSDDLVRRFIREAISSAPAEQSITEKRQMYQRIVSELLVLPDDKYFMGYWDLIRGAEAETEFDSWSSDIESSKGRERQGEAPFRSQAPDHYDVLFVSLIFLAKAGSNSDLTLGDRCDLPESQYFHKHSFRYLLETIPMLNFASIKADAAYAVFGDEDGGISMRDLEDEGYSYLKPLV